MTIDIRTRQVGTLFSLGVEDDTPPWARRRPVPRLRRLPTLAWSHLRMAMAGGRPGARLAARPGSPLS